jgi:hypothetical protein
LQPAERKDWQVVRSADGDFAFYISVKPEQRDVQAKPRGEEQGHVDCDCHAQSVSYHLRRTTLSRPLTFRAALDELARMQKDFLQGNARLIRETKTVADGAPGNDVTYTAPAELVTGEVTRRVRYYLKDQYRYELVVTSTPGQPLLADATRFLSSLAFEALVNAPLASLRTKRPSATRSAAKPPAASRCEAAPGLEIELADATPEEALKTFLLALAAQDGAKLPAVTLPDKEPRSAAEGEAGSVGVYCEAEAAARADADTAARGRR